VEGYGGRIEAANRNGHGTEVRVELPAERAKS
jgi:signal transduction histidine kinase